MAFAQIVARVSWAGRGTDGQWCSGHAVNAANVNICRPLHIVQKHTHVHPYIYIHTSIHTYLANRFLEFSFGNYFFFLLLLRLCFYSCTIAYYVDELNYGSVTTTSRLHACNISREKLQYQLLLQAVYVCKSPAARIQYCYNVLYSQIATVAAAVSLYKFHWYVIVSS